MNRCSIVLTLLVHCGIVFAQPGQPICSSELCRLAASGRLTELHWPVFSDLAVPLQSLYSIKSGEPIWFQGASETPQATAMIKLFRDAASQGLNPEEYDGGRWEERLGRLHSHPSSVSRDDLQRWDLGLTVSALRYVSDLHFGRMNPGLFHSRLDPAHERFNLVDLLRQISVTADVRALVESLDPPFEGYRRTLDALGSHIRLAREADASLPPLPGKTLDAGMTYEGTAQLDVLLRRLGDLPSGAPLSGAPRVYSGSLVDAVKRFQSRHGLDPDGRIGKSTFAQLNVPMARRVRQLELTLERWRWVPHQFPRPPIVVNIPEFHLRAIDQSYRTELEMKVVVGKAYGHQTPVFASDLREVIFRPYWNVPRSIVLKELLPQVLLDRTYLTKNDYEVVTWDGQVVTRGEVGDDLLAKLRGGRLTIRQVPGQKNALGFVKFVFPNEHDVYMHATPARALFSRSRRDFSHGCIRVEKPEILAEWVLRDPEKNAPPWTADRIAKSMNPDAVGVLEPQSIRLRAPIPVLIVYATAVALDGETRFFEDIYGQDAELEAALAKGPPYPSKKRRGH